MRTEQLISELQKAKEWAKHTSIKRSHIPFLLGKAVEEINMLDKLLNQANDEILRLRIQVKELELQTGSDAT